MSPCRIEIVGTQRNLLTRLRGQIVIIEHRQRVGIAIIEQIVIQILLGV